MANRLRARAAPFAILALALSQSAAASDTLEGLSSVGVAHLPALPDEAALVGLVSIDGRPVAVQSAGAWIMDDDQTVWRRAGWPPLDPGSVILSATSDGRRAFLLIRGEDSNATRIARVAFAGERLAFDWQPTLPVALSHARAAPGATTLLVAGIDAAGAPHLLQLSSGSAAGRWISRGGWPGGGTPTSLVAQGAAVYLTVHDAARPDDRLLRWSAQTGWQEKGDAPGSILPGSGRAIGQAHLLYMVRGAQGSARLMSFHTISDAWAALPYQPAGNIVSAAPWRNGVLMALERGYRIGFEAAQLERSAKRLLHWPDWVLIIVYLAAMVGVGVYFKLRHKEGTAEFFVGSRSIPVWAAGISLYATNTSSISYIAIPAKSFETNWTYLSNNLITVFGLMFVATWVVPLLRRLDLVSVFSYLEMRFHPAIRMLASALCVFMQVGGRMSVVMFLPALAISTITGVSVVMSVLLMGVCTIVYTALGGMRAVIWTDCLQVLVMFGGALFAIGFAVYAVGGETMYEIAMAHDKTQLLDFRFDLTQATVWGFVVLTLLDVVLTFPKDQVLMQRALATRSDKSAGRSIWIFAVMTIPGGFIFYGIGTALFAYYQTRPERLDPLLPIDATFPLFIAAELPVGVTGLIIAGILAAAMSTLSSTINSVATLLTVDFYGRLVRNPTQDASLRFAEWTSVAIGVIGIGLALLLSRYDIHSLLDATIELTALLGGGFAGAYTLGMFTRRANAAGVSIGIASAVAVTLAAWSIDLVHSYFYLGISILVCIVVGYVASLAFPAPERSLAGLTIFTGKESEGLTESIPSSSRPS